MGRPGFDYLAHAYTTDLTELSYNTDDGVKIGAAGGALSYCHFYSNSKEETSFTNFVAGYTADMMLPLHSTV